MTVIKSLQILFVLTLIFGFSTEVFAATLRVSPDTGVYNSGKTFTVSVLLNTQSKSVNAADGVLQFKPTELQVVSVNKSSSIFNLWTIEPTFSNAKGTISFGGGSPSGYTGSAGVVLTATVRSLTAGTPKISFTSGSVLAADGLGTNILTSMTGGSYTINAQSSNPEPEYIAPANTPKAPTITSLTHSDENKWYTDNTARLTWKLDSDVSAVRLLHDTEKGSVPTVVYEPPTTEKELTDLSDGTSYLHVQFKNTDGWGKVAHYRINVDRTPPLNLTISEDRENQNPGMLLFKFTSEDASPVSRYMISFDGAPAVEFLDSLGTGQYETQRPTPGDHLLVVTAFDSANNSSVATYSFTVDSFEAPLFTEYPERIDSTVVPIFKGKTRPNVALSFVLRRADTATEIIPSVSDDASVLSDSDGLFTFIPKQAFEEGVYILTARAKDESGLESEMSEEVRFVVAKPAYILLGLELVTILSVLTPLIALLVLIIFGCWYAWHRIKIWKIRLMKETREAESVLDDEFKKIISSIEERLNSLMTLKHSKRTDEETALYTELENDVKRARQKIVKEIEDIEKII